jgi:hypothetical protein
MAGEQWFYAVGGARQGPVTAAQLRRMTQDGRIARDDLVWREGLADWVPARTLKGLFDGPGAPPPVPPPLPKDPGPGPRNNPPSSSTVGWFAAGGLGLVILYLTSRGPNNAAPAAGPPPEAAPGVGGGPAGGEAPAPSPSPEDLAFERQKSATIRAWTAMQQADGQVSAGEYERVSQKLAATVTLYSQFDLNEVDPALRDHILDSIRGFRDASQVFAEFEDELFEVYGDAAALGEFGGLIGRAANDGDPDTGESAGNLLFGILGAAAAEERAKEIQARYQDSVDLVMADLARITERDETLAEELTQRYGETFTDY